MVCVSFRCLHCQERHVEIRCLPSQQAGLAVLKTILHCSVCFENQIEKCVLLPWNHVLHAMILHCFLWSCVLKFQIWNICSFWKPWTSSIRSLLLKPLENLPLAVDMDRADRQFQLLVEWVDCQQPQEWAEAERQQQEFLQFRLKFPRTGGLVVQTLREFRFLSCFWRKMMLPRRILYFKRVSIQVQGGSSKNL